MFSQQGYALLCKLLKSDLARQIYKQMVRDYFRMRENSGERVVSIRITGERFDLSVKRFEVALKAVKLMGIADMPRARRVANEITRDTTGVDLMGLIMPYCSRFSEQSGVAEPEQGEENEILNSFVSAWWDKHGENPVSARQLYQIVADNKIPLSLGAGSRRSQKIRLSRMLSKLNGQQIGGCCVIGAGKCKGVLVWKLKKNV